MGTFVGAVDAQERLFEAARRVLGDVPEGAVTHETLNGLALATLALATTASSEQMRLALEGGAHAVRRAFELAALVLSESVVSDACSR